MFRLFIQSKSTIGDVKALACWQVAASMKLSEAMTQTNERQEQQMSKQKQKRELMEWGMTSPLLNRLS